jgi:hypothetical protein
VPPTARRAVLTLHVAASVGWAGAVAAFLVLALAGLASDDASARGVYASMELLGWWLIVPLSLVTLVSGHVQALGTHWRLLHHYWIVIKLVITVVASILLVVHMGAATSVADAARDGVSARDDVGDLRVQLAVDAAAALLVLLVATALSVVKPAGLTRRGRRAVARRRGAPAT